MQGCELLSERKQIIDLSQIQYDKLVNGKLQKNDVVVCIRGSLGKHGVYPFDQGAIASSLVILRNYFFNICDDEFLLLYLDSPLFFSEIKKYDNGTAQPNLAAKSLEQFLIPLPPLYEQKRIVAKIEELLPLVDRYAAAYEKLEQFNAKFPEDMKKSILQYAIQGKLVEQRAEEGTGEELYQQIQAEKQQLIEEKKIKKEKPLAEISEDEIPFDIPGSWKWVRVGEIFAHNTGKAMNSTAKKVDKPGSVKRFITTSNLYWNSFDFSSVKEMFFSDDELERCTVTKGDLLMCEGGAYYGRTAIWNYDYDICFQNHVHNQFLNVLVNSRVNIMHVKRNQRKPALNGKQSCLYAQKLSLLYRKILFELLQINDSLYLEKLKHCVLNLDNWNSISDDFLSWLSK